MIDRQRSQPPPSSLRIVNCICAALCVAVMLGAGVHAQDPFAGYTSATCAATNVANSNTNNRYDISSLNCVDCSAQGTGRISDGAGGCKCATGYKKVSSGDSFLSFVCVDCVSAGNSSYSDGHDCVPCPAGTLDTTRRDCVCPDGSVITEKTATGAWALSKTCQLCQTGSQWIAPDYYTCQTCPDSRMTMAVGGTCSCPSSYTLDSSGKHCLLSTDTASLDSSAPPSSAVQMYYYDTYHTDTSSMYTPPAVSSETVRQLYQGAAIRCSRNGIREACQTLANLCAYQMYQESSQPCINFGATAATITTISNRFNDWKDSMPYLKYSSDDVLGSKVLQSQLSLHSEDSTGARSQIQTLKFMLVTYALNGTQLAIEELGNQLQLCSSLASTSPTAFTLNQLGNFLRLGTSYSNACTINLEKLLDLTSQPVLYDLYYVDRGNTWYPVPVKVLNQRDRNGNRVNRNSGGEITSTGSLKLNNRFFTHDVVSGLASATATTPQVVQYAQSITLRVTVQESKTALYPPLLVINYQSREWTDIAAGKSSSAVSFTTTYTISQSGVLTAQIVMFALAVVAWFALWVWQICNEQRINKMDAMGPGYCVRVLLNGFALMADFLFWLAFIFCFYYFVFFKGQASSFILLPLPGGSEENTLVAVIVVAFVGKIWRMCYLLYKQMTMDLFLVDYEGSRGLANSIAQGAGQQNPETAAQIKPSAWRRIFIAKKLCDVQMLRAQSMTFTFLLLIFLLRGLNLEYLATSQPQMSNLSPDAAPINKILRFANTAFWLLLIAGTQIVWRKFVSWRYWRDPLMDFVDLCSVSNISVFLFDQRFHSYFIYGKSVHASADVPLEQLRVNMELERRTLTRDRGLDGNGKTVFEFYVNRMVADKYAALNAKMQLELSNRERAGAGAADRRQQQLQQQGAAAANEMKDFGIQVDSSLHRAFEEMNEFLIAFIERTVPSNLDQPMFEWAPGVRSYWNKRFGVPPDIGDGTRNWRFEDPDLSFRDTLLMGIEYELLLFTILLYAVIDLIASNTLASVFGCWIITYFISRARAHWGMINVSRKTLVDDVLIA